MTVDKNGYHSEDGRSITLKRDEKNRVISATDPAGNVITYDYDDRGNLIKVTDFALRTVEFEYDDDHNMTAIIDTSGIAVARNEYDENGKLIAIIDAEGNRVEYDRDIEGRTEAVKDRLGNTTVYVYDEDGNILSTTDPYGNTVSNTYDEDGNMLTTTDALGNTTTNTYDTLGNLTKTVAPDGTSINVEYTQNTLVSSINDQDGNSMLQVDYDDKGRLTTITDANNNAIVYSYTDDGKLVGLADSIGQIQKLTYDSEGNITSTTNGEGESAYFTYDESGRVLSINIRRTEDGEELSFTSYYSYNAAGDVVSTVDNAGNSVHYEYDQNGNNTAVLDSKSRRFTYDYDIRGNLTKATYPDGTFETFTYDANGNNISATSRSGLTTKISYDKLNRPAKTTYADGTYETYEYDANGNVISVTDYAGAKTTYGYDSCGRNTSITDALGNTTTFTYDSYGKLIKTIDADKNYVNYSYDGNGNIIKVNYQVGYSETAQYDARGRITMRTDGNGNKTYYEYDKADRLIKVTDPYGNSYSYEYDPNGNLRSVTDPENHVTSYEYDEVGHVIKTTNPLGKSMEYTYDECGNLTSSSDYMGIVTYYTYDLMDRLVEKQIGDEVTTYTYDDTGLLLEVTNKNGTVSYNYDEYNRLTSKTDERGVTISYGYDSLGRYTGINNGFDDTTYEYDILGRLISVTDGDGEKTTYEYSDVGDLTEVSYPNGVKIKYEYSLNHRLSKEYVYGADGKADYLYNYYTFDRNNNRTRVIETDYTTGVKYDIRYEYDKLNRLTRENITCGDTVLTNEYTYDVLSNRTSKTTTVTGDISKIADRDNDQVEIVEGTTTYTYNALNQLVTESRPEGDIIYTYDDNGSLIGVSGLKTVDYSYDLERHLIRATIQEGNSVTVESYTYDYNGIRTSKTINELDTTYYVVDTAGDLSQVVAETDADGNLTASYVRGHDLISVESGEEKWYYVCDGRGSVRHLLDEEGTVTDSYSYDAYGMLLTKSGDTDNAYMYVGEEYNANTGLYYLRARYMNPSTGSFTTMDSYQGSLYEPISLHKYAYANANPVSNIDPSGYFSIAECTVVQTIRSNINEIVQIQALRKIMTWANVACTTYDVCVTLREMFLHDASSLAIFDSILKGMVIDQLVNCLLGGHLKIIAKAIMACKGLGDQVDTIKADIERGDPVAAGFHALQLITMIFSIMAQCFTGETEVMTDEGLIAIEDIEVGDYVLAEDTVTGEQEYKEVLNVFVSQTNKLVHVTTDSGSDTTTEITTETTINTTDNHPFYVEGKGWVPAIELEAGDVLRTSDGSIETVLMVEVECLDEAVLVYNLEIEGYHTYYVSDESVLVHNTYDAGDGGNGNSEGGSSSNSRYIPMDADGNPIPLNKQRVNGQDIPLPDPDAQGRPHTVLGSKISSKTGEIYLQSATFPGGTYPSVNGYDVPWSEVHWTDHDTPQHHANPHQHIFIYNPDKGGWIRTEPTPYYPKGE